MNCFEFQNRTSDYLDGALIGAKKQEADAHLDSCGECSERHGHYRTVISTLAAQPRSALPIPIRKAPFTASLPKLDLRTGLSGWDRVPWYLRTTIEATTIVLLTLVGISMGPKVRTLYERKIERSLSDFNQTFNDPAQSAAKPAPAVPRPEGEGAAVAHDDFASEDEEEEDTESPPGNQRETEEAVRVGKSDIWRFMLKSDSPHEFRSKITEILTSLKAAGDTQNFDGVRAPGGIQFDVVLPQSAIPTVKKQLEALAPPPPEGLADTPAGETFTWYKIKSKRKIPDGMTRVVIWLSQM